MISSNKSGISKFFKRYFMAYIVMLVITIIAFFILYNRSSFILENIYIDNQLVALRQVSTRMDDNLAEIMNASFLVASNPRVRGIVPLSDPFGDTNVIRLREAMHSVAHFQTRNPLVANLFVAYEQGNVALNANFASNLEHFYIRHMQFYDMPFWYWRDMVFAETHRSRFIPAMYTQYQPHTQQQFIQYTTPIGGTAENRGVVVSLISNRAIYDKFREMNLGGESGSVFILSSQGEVISVVADSLGMQCIYDIPIGREGSSRFDRGSVSYLVSYTTSNLLGWTYVSVVRSDYVLAGLNVFRRSLLSVLLIAMAVTVVLSVIFSIQHARPMKKLEDAVAAHMPMLWYSYFHNLFKGQFYEENDALKGWEHLGLSLQGKLYKTVIVKIPDADSNINIGSVQAVAKLSMLLDEYIRGNTDADISIHRQPGGDEIAILFICGQCNTANIDGYVQSFCGWLAGQHTQTGEIIIGIGGTYQNLTDVHKSYEEAGEAIQYYTVLDSARVLCAYEEIPRNKEFYYYPEQEEQRLVNMVKSGDSEGVRTALNALCGENLTGRQLPNSMMAAFINHLWQGVVKIDRLNLVTDEALVAKINESYDTFHNINDLQKLKLCTQLYMEICESLQANKQSNFDTLMTEIKQFIDDNFHDPDISLAGMADKYGMSETYFSLRFKEHAEENFFNYVQALRINKSIQLLETSKLPILEISERVGYSNYNTFAKAFKRITGVSGGEYRRVLKKGRD